MKNAKAYLAIDTVLVCCLLALTMAPGLVELLASLPESVTMGIGLVLLLASDYYWGRAASPSGGSSLAGSSVSCSSPS